jgi:AmiR/NasT family two-component response regulator
MERTLAELLLHFLVLTVDRIVTVDRFRESEANFERAVESHRLVGQAMGILIERHRIVSDEAFDVLRRTSQDHNVKLREVAQRVIDTGAEPDEVV